jgi:hypothetical protein
MSLTYDDQASTLIMMPEKGTKQLLQLPKIIFNNSQKLPNESFLFWNLSNTGSINFPHRGTESVEFDYASKVTAAIITTYDYSLGFNDLISQSNRDKIVQFNYCSSANINPNGSRGNSDITISAGSVWNHKIIGYTEINRDLILFTTVPGNGENNFGAIWRITSNMIPELIYANDKLNFSTENLIRSVGHQELDDLSKVHWVDGDRNPYSYINLDKDNFWNVATNQLRACPKFLIETPSIAENIQGDLKFGATQYCFYYYTAQGSRTRTSPTSYLATPLTNGKSGQPNERSTTGYRIGFYTDSQFEFVRMYRFSYTEANGSPEVHLIYDGKITPGYQSVYDRGVSSELATSSIDEIYANQPDVFKAEDITYIDKSIILSGIIEQPFIPEFDARAYRFPKLNLSAPGNEYRALFYDKLGQSFSVGPNAFNNAAYNGTNPTYQEWKVPTDHDVIPAANLELNYDPNNKTTLGSYRYNLHTQELGALGPNVDIRFDTVNDNTGSFSHSGGSKYYTRDYKTGEVYRFSIELIDSYGRVSPSYFSCDLKMPEMHEILNETQSTTNQKKVSHESGSVNKLYPVFTVNNVPQGTIAYRISRAYRGNTRGTVVDQVVLSQSLKVSSNAYEDYSNIHLPSPTIGFTNLYGNAYIWQGGMDRGNTLQSYNNSSQYLFDEGTVTETFAIDAFSTPTSLDQKYINMYSPKYLYTDNINFENVHLSASWMAIINNGGHIDNKDRYTINYIDKKFMGFGTITNDWTYTVKYGDTRLKYHPSELNNPVYTGLTANSVPRGRGYNFGIGTTPSIFYTFGKKSTPIATPKAIQIGSTLNRIYPFTQSTISKTRVEGSNESIYYRNYSFYSYRLQDYTSYGNELIPSSYIKIQSRHCNTLFTYFGDNPVMGHVWYDGHTTFDTASNTASLAIADLKKGASITNGTSPQDINRIAGYYTGPSHAERQSESYIPCTEFSAAPEKNPTTHPEFRIVKNGDIFRTTVPILRQAFRYDAYSDIVRPQGHLLLDMGDQTISIKEFVTAIMESTINVDICPENKLDEEFSKDTSNFFKHFDIYEREDVLFRNSPTQDYQIYSKKFSNLLYASTPTVPGSAIDSATQVNALVTGEVRPELGPITSIHNFKDNLVVVQGKGVSIYAINTKVQTQTNAGQLGIAIGNFFYDLTYVSDKFGCRHKFGPILSNNAIYVPDDVSQKILRIAGQSPEQLSDSILGHHILKDMAPNPINEGNVYSYLGIVSGYDSKKGLIYFTFHNTGNISGSKTLSFSEATNSIVSYHSEIKPKLYIPHDSKVYAVHNDGTDETFYTSPITWVNESQIWQLGEGNPFSYFVISSIPAAVPDAYVDFIVNKPGDIAKQYISLEAALECYLNGNNHEAGNISSYQVYNEYQNTGLITNANWKFRKRFRGYRWQISRDINSASGRKRIHNKWAHVKFTFNPGVSNILSVEHIYKLHFVNTVVDMAVY